MHEETLSQLYLKDTAFQALMQKRIFHVLLIASPYDAFMMEEDGRVEEQLYFEYVSLNLSSPPRVTRISHIGEALNALAEKPYDLIIAMPGNSVTETFEGAKAIKRLHPAIPLVVLTPFSKEVSQRISREDITGVDYVFSWLGNVELLLAIIKLIEDKMNAEHDITQVGVQAIMLVEDSVRFYSSVLPHLYKFILTQSRNFSTEALNEHEKMLRMRGRPKVILARNYEEAVDLYSRFGNNMLGVITDVSFNRGGVKDRSAGLELGSYLRGRDPYLPIIVESTETANRDKVNGFHGVFIDKNSKKLPVDLGKAITDNFGFGDFILRDPATGEEIGRITSVNDMQKKVFNIPDEVLYNHCRNNEVSRWLYSRAMFPIAEVMKAHRFTSIDEAPAVKQLIFDLIVKYRRMKNRGVVAIFRRDRFDHYSNFARIGQGSLGGKGRGLAFIDSVIKKHPVCDNFDGLTIAIPRTLVLCTDIFDEFMAMNDLYPVALSDASDREILERFTEASLPARLTEDFMALFEVVDRPLAVRSSSLLEDSHYQPFAGIYSTYMIPNVKDKECMLQLLAKAIKGVYASVFFRDSKAYMTATANVIDQEKMAVIIQEVVGREWLGSYFPSFSGVGRSLNYYPLNDEVPADGVVELAVGLGKYIVDGGMGLRFSPVHPDKILQTSTLDLALRDTQKHLLALDMQNPEPGNLTCEEANLVERNIQDFAGTGALRYLVSTYNAQDMMLRDNDEGRGRRVVTFANILTHNALPLAKALRFMLTTGQDAMQRPVEIEFAGLVAPPGSPVKGQVYWLQIRPIVDPKNMVDDTLLEIPDAELLLRSDTALGHGNIDNVDTVVYVRPETFNRLNNPSVARELENVNARFVESGRGYVLIGPGRWGSSDPSLGIPVKWPDISGARLIVEAAIPGYRVEPSQGTHFFQNLTSMGVGYFTVDTTRNGNALYDIEFLNSQPAEYESESIRIVRFPRPLYIGINGRKGAGVVAKPSYHKPQENVVL